MKRLFLLLLMSLFCLSAADTASGQAARKLSVMWCDPLLNIGSLSSRGAIISMLRKIKDARFEGIALGVKTISGEVIYESKVAPRLLEWKRFRVPLDFDPVATVLEEGRRLGLQVYAVIPLFAEGHVYERQGPIYNNKESWQATVYVVDEGEPKLMPMTKWAHGYVAYANPLATEVKNYQVALVKEFLDEYTVDGIVFDKGRFSGIESDFSTFTRGQFQIFLGSQNQINWWPEDVYEMKLRDGEWEIVPGKYFADWLQFRSQKMKDFYKRLIDEVRRSDPSLPVGAFVGGWYPTHYDYGVNWASIDSDQEDPWVRADYSETGVADILNYLVVGSYFGRISMQDAENIGADWWMSVEGSCIMAMDVVDNKCPVYSSILIEQFRDDREKLKEALRTAKQQTDGLYVYDVSAVEEHDLWGVVAEAMREDIDLKR